MQLFIGRKGKITEAGMKFMIMHAFWDRRLQFE